MFFELITEIPNDLLIIILAGLVGGIFLHLRGW
jgi:hypothetical protein